MQLKQLGNSLLLHRDAVENVRLLHRASSVGDEDKLGVCRHAAYITGVTGNVHIVQSRLDLVEDTERRGSNLEYCKEKCDRRKSLFSARKQVDVLNILARRLYLDFNVTFQNVVRVFKNKLRLSAAEKLDKGFAEIAVDAYKLSLELLRHFTRQLRNEPVKLVTGFFNVVKLSFHKFVTLGDLFVFLDRSDIDIAQGSDLAFQLLKASVRLLIILYHNVESLGVGFCELIFVKELVDRIVKLFFHLCLAFLKSCKLAADLFTLG